MTELINLLYLMYKKPKDSHTEMLHTFQITKKIIPFITKENVKYICPRVGITPLMIAFGQYGDRWQADSYVFHKMLDLDCNESFSSRDNWTAAMVAFYKYGNHPKVDNKVLLRLLDKECDLTLAENSVFNSTNSTALIMALSKYGSNPRCDYKVLLKLLDKDCNPGHSNRDGITALIVAFYIYSKNPNYNPKVILKLLDKDCNPQASTTPPISTPTIWYAYICLCSSKISSVNCKILKKNVSFIV